MQSPASLLDLHRRLLAGDKKAADVLIDRLLVPLQRQLAGRNGDHKYNAVADALIDFVKHPAKFKPDKGKIEPFLLLAAQRNLSNERRKEYRQRVRDTAMADVQRNNVELRSAAGNSSLETVSNDAAMHCRLLAALDPADRPVAELQLRLERKTSVYAEALGLSGLSVNEQRQMVKRAKDRVNKTRVRLKG